MRIDLHDYAVYPRIVPSGKKTTVSICPRGGHADFPEGYDVPIKIIPLENSVENTDAAYPIVLGRYQNGRVTFEHTFEGEQEHRLQFQRPRGEGRPDRFVEVNLSVYSALPDMYALRPYRGDLHVHTNQSDGREAPETTVANYRAYGYDFLALTDHRRFEPSQRVIKKYSQIPTSLALFGGEEVHTPINHIHIVNFGANASVNSWANDDPTEYAALVDARMAELPELPEGVDQREYAACLVLFDKIRELHGLAIFPHPHWISEAYHVRDAVTWQIFRDHAFDAFELLGGQTPHENNMQTLIYEQALMEGLHFPVVGSSDSHINTNTSLYGDSSVLEEQTIVFSPDTSRDSILSSIRAEQSVAVSAYRGAEPYVFGNYRFGKYALFLLSEYFPQHDELCAIEGGIMRLWLEGNPHAVPMLQVYADEINAYMERCFKGIDE